MLFSVITLLSFTFVKANVLEYPFAFCTVSDDCRHKNLCCVRNPYSGTGQCWPRLSSPNTCIEDLKDVRRRCLESGECPIGQCCEIQLSDFSRSVRTFVSETKPGACVDISEHPYCTDIAGRISSTHGTKRVRRCKFSDDCLLEECCKPDSYGGNDGFLASTGTCVLPDDQRTECLPHSPSTATLPSVQHCTKSSECLSEECCAVVTLPWFKAPTQGICKERRPNVQCMESPSSTTAPEKKGVCPSAIARRTGFTEIYEETRESLHSLLPFSSETCDEDGDCNDDSRRTICCEGRCATPVNFYN
ncbi:Uncharacterised protein g1255 [Pycnogonum litorale]